MHYTNNPISIDLFKSNFIYCSDIDSKGIFFIKLGEILDSLEVIPKYKIILGSYWEKSRKEKILSSSESNLKTQILGGGLPFSRIDQIHQSGDILHFIFPRGLEFKFSIKNAVLEEIIF